ncbi:MAG: PHP domain-containing protein [Acidobacteriota bacterium]|nr:PHP domain-containing protein [Acidobacteriota bacterium]
MKVFADLHIHSRHSSDGEWTVPQIFAEARRVGLDVFSISDHDTVAALEEAFMLAADFPGEYLANVEVSVRHRGMGFHLLAPLVDWHDRPLLDLLARIRLSRVRQNEARVGLLRALGFDISYEEVREALGPVAGTGPAIASVVLSKASNRNHALVRQIPSGSKLSPEIDFYKFFFLPGGPAFAAKETVSLPQAIETVRAAGGVPVLAHPGQKSGVVDERWIRSAREMGMEGIEAYSSYHTGETCRYYEEIARRLDLVVTSGSDFHGRVKPQVAFGDVPRSPAELVDRLKERRERVAHG